MKAVRLHSYGERPAVEEVAEPEITDPLDVIVRIGGAGLCRTDLHIIEGDLAPATLPVIPGHQVVGVVDQLGSGSTRFKIGERVKLAFQADGFNVNNAVHFGTPGTNIDAANFGTVSSMANQTQIR